METKTGQATATGVFVGGYTTFHCVTKDELALFNEVKMPLGVDYQPVACATQVVAGENYKFFCNAKVVAPDTPNEIAMVTIFRPLNGMPELTNIERIG
jgi:hypothetical protein